MYQVKSGEKTYKVEPSKNDNEYLLNDELTQLDFKKVGEGKYHVIRNNKGYDVEFVQVDEAEKKVSLKINGQVYPYEVKDKMDLLLEKMGLNNLVSSKVSAIKAPMPGLVLEIMAQPGDEVKKGNGLIILEAMKMENVIKSPIDGTVKGISVNPKDAVEKNQVLIEFK